MFGCNLCGNDKISLMGVKDGYRVYRCKVCGLVYTPIPVQTKLQEYYDTLEDRPIAFPKHYSIAVGKLFHRLIQQFRPKSTQILDIGCSTGYILDGLRHYGYFCKGTDISKPAVQYARSIGLDVEEGEFPCCKTLFDVIILNHVLEHISNPLEFLKKASEYLVPGGIVIIGTPNANSITFKIFGLHWSPVCPPGHLNLFNRNSMRLLVTEAGYQLLMEKTETGFGFYNMVSINVIALLSLLGIKKKTKVAFSKDVSIIMQQSLWHNRLTILVSVASGLTRAVSLSLLPLSLAADKLGWGENLLVVCKKI